MPRPATPDELGPETITAIRNLMTRELRPAGVREPDVVIMPGEDHDGDPAIIVRIRYRHQDEPFDGRAAARALFKLNNMLHERGESRFAYIIYAPEGAGA